MCMRILCIAMDFNIQYNGEKVIRLQGCGALLYIYTCTSKKGCYK